MAIAVDQASIGTGDAGSGTTCSITTSATVASGATIILAGGSSTSSRTLDSVSGGGLTWVVDKTQTETPVTSSLARAYAPAGLASGTVITGTWSGSSNSRIMGAASFTVVDPAAPLDTTGGSSSPGATTAVTTGSITTAAAGELIVAAVYFDNPGRTNAETSPAVEAIEYASARADGWDNKIVLEYRIEAAAGSYSVDSTASGNTYWTSAGGAYKADLGGAPPYLPGIKRQGPFKGPYALRGERSWPKSSGARTESSGGNTNPQPVNWGRVRSDQTPFKGPYARGFLKTPQDNSRTEAHGGNTNPPTWLTRWVRKATPFMGPFAKGLARRIYDDVPASGLARVSATRELVYDVYAKTSATRAIKYDILNRVTPSRALVYDIRATVTATRAVKYDILAKTSTTRAVTYDIRAPASATRAIKYDVLAKTSATRAVTYDISGRVAATRALVYDVADGSSSTPSDQKRLLLYVGR